LPPRGVEKWPAGPAPVLPSQTIAHHGDTRDRCTAGFQPGLCRLLCTVQVFARRERRPTPTLRRPASEKRQGTKSREIRSVGRCRKLSYGDLSGARAGWVLARVESWRDWAP